MNTFKILFSTCFICVLWVENTRLKAQIPRKADHAPYSINIIVACHGMTAIDSLFIYFSELSYSTMAGKENVRPLKSIGNQTFVYCGNEQFPQGQFVIRAKAPAGTTWAERGKHIELTRLCYWEAGDSVTLSIQTKHRGSLTGNVVEDYLIAFTGPGAEKYTIEHSIFQSYYSTISRSMADTKYLSDSGQDIEIKAIEAALTRLESARDLLSDFYYQLFKADYIAKQFGPFNQLRHQYEEGLSRGIVLFNKEALDRLLNTHLDSVADDIPDAVKAKSRSYVNYLYEKFFFEMSVCDSINNNKDYVALIADRYDGPLRDRLLLHLVVKDKGKQDINEIYRKANLIITDPDCLRVLQGAASRLRGMQAFDFELPDINGRPIRLASLKGKVVFIDVWFSKCGACAAYYRNVLKQAEKKLGSQQDIVFVSLSVDRNKDVWSKSVAAGIYTSEEAVNLYTDGKGAMHEWLEHYNLGAFPTFMILDKSGCIYHIYEDRFMDEINSTDALVNTLNKIRNIQAK